MYTLTLSPNMEPLQCACGCGKTVRLDNTYITGHNTKKSGRLKLLGKELYASNPNLCECGCGLNVTANSRFVRGHWKKTQEARHIQSQRLSSYWKDPEYRSKTIAMSRSPEQRALASGAAIRQHKDNPRIARNLTRYARTPEARKRVSEVARQTHKNHPELVINNLVRSKPVRTTDIEQLAMESLVKIRQPFLTQVPIKYYVNYVRADQILTDYKVAIFEDGCYWHGCRQHGRENYNLRNGKPISEIRALDSQVTLALQSLGWTVIRAWEHEIKADHDIIAKRVTEAIKSLQEIEERQA